MNQRRLNLVTIALLVLVALALTAGGVLAQSSPSGITVPYSSRLTDPTGQPVTDGQYDFIFTLYASEKDNQALWSERQSGLYIRSGNLDITLGRSVFLPKDVADRKELWLSVSVRGPQDSDFTLLNPRHNLSPMGGGGGGGLTCPHTHFSDYWSGANQAYGLHVENYGGGDSVRAYSYSTKTDYAGVYAWDIAGSGDGTGVYGGSYYGSGVQAYSQYNDGLEATSDTTWASAIYAHSTNGNGVWGVSGNKIGVYAGTASTMTNVAALQAYNSGAPTSGYGGNITSKNYRGGFIGTQNYSWYGAVVDGGLLVTNGACSGCTLVYVGRNNGDETVHPGDLVAIAGVAIEAVTNQPVMLIRLAQSASDPVIGVVVGGASAPSSQTAPDKPQTGKIMRGEYMQIAVSGLVQARVAAKSVAIGDRLSAGPAGATVASDDGNSVARVMSAPDANGLVWVLVDGR